jgi:hypothetical protein
LARGTKNLAEVETRQEKPMREGTKTDQATVKGKIVQFVWKLKNEGYQETTIREYTTELETLLRKGANLLDPRVLKKLLQTSLYKILQNETMQTLTMPLQKRLT